MTAHPPPERREMCEWELHESRFNTKFRTECGIYFKYNMRGTLECPRCGGRIVVKQEEGMSNEDEITPPKVTGSPDRIWLVYGDIDGDCTHAECYRQGDVTWCTEPQFDSDVAYIRADLHAELVAALREAYGFTTADTGLLPERIKALLAKADAIAKQAGG